MTTKHEDESAGWDEAMLGAVLHEVHGEAPPDLSVAILERTGYRARARVATVPAAPAVPFAGGTRPWAAAALVAFSALSVFAVAFAARDGVLSQGNDKRLVPLDPGAAWVYRVDREGTVTELKQWAMTVFPFPAAGEKEPRAVCQLLVDDGGDVGFEYLAADARGVFRHARTRGRAMWGLDAQVGLARLVALPVGVEKRWETDEQVWLPVAGGGPGAGAGAGGGGGRGGAGGLGGAGAPGGAAAGRNQRSREHRVVELVDPAEKVKVPAGEFQAVHVRSAPAGAAGASAVEHLWLAAGTGIVRRVLELDGKVVETQELRSFTPGAPDPDPKSVLAKFLQRDAGVTELGPAKSTEWIEPTPENLRLRARFAVVTFVEKKQAFCVRGGAVRRFDPADVDQWTEIVRDEGMTRWNDGLLPQARCCALTDLAARLRAAQLGWKAGARPIEMAFRAGPGASMHWVLTCVDGEGKSQRLWVDVAIGSDDHVTRVAFPE